MPRHVIRGWAKEQEYSDQLAGGLAKLLHDQDGHLNTLHGEGHSLAGGGTEGLWVCNQRGDTWHTRCDGQLFVENSGQDLAVHLPVEAVRASVKELFMVYLGGDDGLPAGRYEATAYVPFPHPDGPGLFDKFPASISAAKVEKLLESAQWYMKIPYIGPGLAAEHIKALFATLPQLLEQFRQAVRRDAVEGSELTRRLPEALVEAFESLR